MRAGFFAKVVELQQRYRGNKIIANSLQTNGILLNDKWARFCVVMDFWSDYPLMALRPPRHWRTTGCGKPTREKVVQAIRCLQQHDVPVNAMVVVSRQSASQGKSLYRCLSRELNLHHLQFIPLVDSPAPGQLPLRAGANFCAVFSTTGWKTMLAGCLSSTLIICSAYGPASPPRSAPCSLSVGRVYWWSKTAMSTAAITLSQRNINWVI